jgi:hypothetical protein
MLTMHWKLPIALFAAFFVSQTLAAEAQSISPAAASLPRARCLTDQQREINAKLKALKRPTTREDPLWVFDPNYFVGTWDLEWGGPDTILTTEVTGTLTVAHVEGCFYEGNLQAKDVNGPFTAKIQLLMDPDRSWLTWVENDSRGFTIVKSGFVGSDLGGYFTHFWEHSPVITYKGQKLRLYGSTFMSSPAAFLLRSQLSVDGGSYLDMGGLWFRKQVSSSPAAAR